MKKVGKEFKKTLSAILVAAMVFTSLPQTTLVAKAEEAEAVDLSEFSEVGGDESRALTNVTFTFTDDDTNASVSGLTANATVKYDDDSKLVFIPDVTLGGTNAKYYDLVSVEGLTGKTTVDAVEAYRYTSDSEPTTVNVRVKKKQFTLTDKAIAGSGRGEASVEYFVGSTKLTSSAANTYTVDAGSTVKAVVTVTEDADTSYTVKYRLSSFASERADEDITSTRKALTGDDAGKYTYEFTVAMGSNKTIDKIEVAKATDQTVSFTVNDTVSKIVYSKDAKAALSSYSSVDLSKKTVKLAPGDYYFIITDSKTISSVTADTTPVYPTTVTAGTAYKITVPTDSGVTVAVTEAATDATINLTSTNVDAIYYTTDNSVAYADRKTKAVKLTGSSIKVATDATVYLFVDYKEHFEEGTVKIGDADAPSVSGKITVDTTGNATTAVVITAAKIENQYTFNAIANATITINTDNVIAATDGSDPIDFEKNDIVLSTDSTKGIAQAVVTVEDGDDLSFKIEPAAGYKNPTAILNGVKVSQTDANYPFVFESAKATVGTVTAAVEPYATASITFTNDTAAKTPNDAYTITSQLEKIVITGEKDATGKVKDDYDLTGLVKSDVAEKSSISFKVVAKTGYDVKKVEYKVGANDAVVLSATNGVYTISSTPAEDATVTVYTQIKADAAKSITFRYSDDATVELTGITNANAYQFENAYPVKNEVTILTTADSVPYKVTPSTGYKITKVDNVDQTSVAGVEYSNTYTFATGETSKTIDIVVEADKATAAKYIKIADDNWYTFELSDAEVVATNSTATTYKISEDTLEAAFKVTVDYGYTVSFDGAAAGAINFDDTNAVRNGTKVTYSGKFVTNLLGLTDKKNPQEITLSPVAKNVNVQFVTGSQIPTDVKFGGEADSFNDAGYDTPIKVGTKVVFKVPDHYKLYSVDKAGKNPTELTVDTYGKYSFVVADDTYFKIVEDLEAVDYTVTATRSYKDEDGNTQTETPSAVAHANNTFEIPVDTIEVDLTVALKTPNGRTTTIEEVKTDSEKTTATVDANTVKVKVSKEDAGKNVAVTMTVENKDANGVVKKDTAVATLAIDAVLTGIAIDGIANGATITLDPAVSVTYKASVVPTSFEVPAGMKIKDLVNVSVSVEKGTAATTAVFTKDDILKITSAGKEETATIKVTDKDDAKKVLFTATVNTVVPSYKLAKVDSPSQSANYVNITLTPDKSVQIDKNSTSLNDKVFYEVVVNSVGDTTPSGSLANKAYYFAVPFDADGKAQPVSAAIAVNTAKEATAGTYSFASRIVIVSSSVKDVTPATDKTVVAVTNAVTPVSDTAIVSAGNTIVKKFDTRNAYYEDKLSLTKKSSSIYNSGDKQVMAVVKYSKNASYLGDVYGEVLNANGEDTVGFTVTADQTTGEVYVQTGAVVPGKYTLVVYATGTDTANGEQALYRASAKMNFTVNQSIRNIVETDKMIKLNPKKDVSLTLKPELSGVYYGNKYYANKSKALKYTLNTSDMDAAAAKNVKANVVVDEKTGKITVKKGFVLGNDAADNTFKVKIEANDFARNNAWTEINVTVTGESIALGEVYLVNGATAKKAATTLSMKEAKNTYLVVLDKDGKDVSEYVTYKSSNSAVKINAKTGRIDVKKPAKNVTFTVTTTDGSKKSLKSAKYTINFDKASNLSLQLTSGRADALNTLVEVAENSYEYFGTANAKFSYTLVDLIADANGNETPTPVDSTLYSYKLSIKGGKITKSVDANGILTGSVVPTAETTVITLTDNTNKATKKISIRNTNFQTTKAPSAKLVEGKLYNTNVATDLTFQVGGKVMYDYVYVTKDSGLNTTGLVEKEYQIIDGKFTLNLSSSGNKVGTDKYTLVYGYLDKGVFYPQTKAATLSIKVNKVADFKPQTTYTYNPYDSSNIVLTGKPADVEVGYNNISNANIGGKPNKFLDYFTLAGQTLQATGKLTEKAIADGINPQDLTGYVSYTYTNPKGHTVTKDVKITVKIENVQKGYAATGVTVLNKVNTFGYSLATSDGKGFEIASVQAVDTANWKADAINPATKDAKGNITQNIKLTALKAQAAGTQEVQVYVIPEDSPYKGKDIKKYGTLITIPVTVVDAKESVDKVIVKDCIDLNKTGDTGFGTKTGGYWEATAKEDVVYEYTLDDASKIASAKVAENAPEGFSVELNKEKDGIEFTVLKKNVDANKIYSVPVEVTFEDGSASEVIVIEVITPFEIQTMADIKAVIEDALNVTAYTGSGMSAQNVKDAIETYFGKVGFEIDDISCVSYEVTKVESVEETKADSTKVEVTKKVTVTLTDKTDSKVTDTVVAELPKDVESIQWDETDVYTDIAIYAGYIMSENDYKELEAKAAAGTINDAEKKKMDNALVVTNSTTRFDVREQLEKGIKNSNYMLSIVSYSKQLADDEAPGTNGSITFSYRLVDKDKKYNVVTPAPVTINHHYVATP